MRIPANFKTTISKIFYDKEFLIYETQDYKDDHYWQKKAHTTKVVGSFKGNIRFNKLDVVQKDYGITVEIDAVITTDTSIANETIIGYLGTQMIVYRAIKNDSHYFLIMQLFKPKSDLNISA